MSYKALAFDLDGTLLASNGTILAENKKAIQTARANGIKVYIVTGRHHTAVRPYYAELELDTPVICCNGTYIYHFAEDKVLFGNPLSTEQVERLVNAARAQDIHTAIYTRDAMTYEKLNPHFTRFTQWVNSCPEAVRPNVYQVENFQQFIDEGTLIWKVLISDPDLAKMRTFADNLSTDEFSAEWSWVDRVDITAAGNSKGSGLARLLTIENIAPEEVIAFGDNFNDTSMLEYVGMGVAMGNAEEEVKTQADLVIGSNNEESIAQALKTLLG